MCQYCAGAPPSSTGPGVEVSAWGFGFASALADIGLPQGDIPLALFAFNVGVEAGQLIFIAAVLGLLRIATLIKFPIVVERYARPVTTYAIGIMAAYWFIERLAGFAT